MTRRSTTFTSTWPLRHRKCFCKALQVPPLLRHQASHCRPCRLGLMYAGCCLLLLQLVYLILGPRLKQDLLRISVPTKCTPGALAFNVKFPRIQRLKPGTAATMGTTCSRHWMEIHSSLIWQVVSHSSWHPVIDLARLRKFRLLQA